MWNVAVATLVGGLVGNRVGVAQSGCRFCARRDRSAAGGGEREHGNRGQQESRDCDEHHPCLGANERHPDPTSLAIPTLRDAAADMSRAEDNASVR
jgi:hypothetical protein